MQGSIFIGLSDDENVDKLNPRTKEEFMAFKDALCRKILSYKKSDHFLNFIEELIRDLSANCKYLECIQFLCHCNSRPRKTDRTFNYRFCC